MATGSEPATESSTTSATVEAAEPSPLRSRFDDLVAALLERRGLDAAVTECALAELDDSIGDAEIKAATDEIRKTGIPPPEITEAAAAAGEACSGDEGA